MDPKKQRMIGLLVGTGFSLWAAWKLSKCSCLGSAEAKKKDARDELQREYLDYRLLADENPYYSGQDRVPSQRKKARQQKPADERQVTQAARKEAQNNRHLLLPQFAGQESTRDQRSRVSAVVETANVLSKNKKERRRLAAVSAVVETANVISKKECRREQAAAAAAAYCETVDSYIRTRHDFDSAEPTALWVAIRHVKQNCPSPPGASCASVLGAAHHAFEFRDGHVRLLRLTHTAGLIGSSGTFAARGESAGGGRGAARKPTPTSGRCAGPARRRPTPSPSGRCCAKPPAPPARTDRRTTVRGAACASSSGTHATVALLPSAHARRVPLAEVDGSPGPRAGRGNGGFRAECIVFFGRNHACWRYGKGSNICGGAGVGG